MDFDIDHLRSWIGKTQTADEVLNADKVAQFSATMDRNWPVDTGAEAPLLIHLCLTQPAVPMSELGRDGHPALGGFLPPVPLPRRMWAGGAFEFHAPLQVGDTVTRTSTITDVQMKQGRTGALCFVTVSHEISAGGKTAITERQDIVYRDVSQSGAAPAPAPEPAPEGPHHRVITSHPTLLFRYSALTFNGHRIHYDRTFCTDDEGYPGLVVHGPMQATMLCHLAAEVKGRAPRSFRFRSVSPVFDTADFTLNAEETADGLSLWTAQVGGPFAMKAQASW